MENVNPCFGTLVNMTKKISTWYVYESTKTIFWYGKIPFLDVSQVISKFETITK